MERIPGSKNATRKGKLAAQAKPKSAHKVQKISDVEPVLASQTLVLREKVLQGELVLADDENTSETLVLRQKVSDVEPVLTTGYDKRNPDNRLDTLQALPFHPNLTQAFAILKAFGFEKLDMATNGSIILHVPRLSGNGNGTTLEPYFYANKHPTHAVGFSGAAWVCLTRLLYNIERANRDIPERLEEVILGVEETDDMTGELVDSIFELVEAYICHRSSRLALLKEYQICVAYKVAERAVAKKSLRQTLVKLQTSPPSELVDAAKEGYPIFDA